MDTKAALSESPREPASREGLDRVWLEERLDSIRRETQGDDRAFRVSAVDLFRSVLEQGRVEARKMLEQGGSGRGCAERLSDLEDQLVGALHDMARRHIHPGIVASARLTILAVGGYGRGLLAPGSDIDLLFLLPEAPDPGNKKIIETMLYVLWDLKQKVGHSTRSLDECLKQARADMTIRTSILEARMLSGDEPLVERLLARFDKEIVAKTAFEFVAAKLAERDARVKRAGASRYLVEPNVKEGKGGLRDLNTLFWIAKYVYRG